MSFRQRNSKKENRLIKTCQYYKKITHLNRNRTRHDMSHVLEVSILVFVCLFPLSYFFATNLNKLCQKKQVKKKKIGFHLAFHIPCPKFCFNQYTVGGISLTNISHICIDVQLYNCLVLPSAPHLSKVPMESYSSKFLSRKRILAMAS